MTQHPTDPGLIAQGGSETAGIDILAEAKSLLAEVSDDPLLVHLLGAGDIVGICDGLAAEVERLRGSLDALATELQAHTTPSDDDHEIICDVESTIAHRIRDVLRGNQ